MVWTPIRPSSSSAVEIETASKAKYSLRLRQFGFGFPPPTPTPRANGGGPKHVAELRPESQASQRGVLGPDHRIENSVL